MSELALSAAIRPGEWNLPLFLHVLGAMAAVGALILTLSYLLSAWRGGAADSIRLAFRALLLAVIPSYLVMRISAQWIYDEQEIGAADSDPAWVTLGFLVTDVGLLLILAATITVGLAARRARGAVEAPIGTGGIRTVTSLVSLLLLAYVVAIWAMTTKPA